MKLLIKKFKKHEYTFVCVKDEFINNELTAMYKVAGTKFCYELQISSAQGYSIPTIHTFDAGIEAVKPIGQEIRKEKLRDFIVKTVTMMAKDLWLQYKLRAYDNMSEMQLRDAAQDLKDLASQTVYDAGQWYNLELKSESKQWLIDHALTVAQNNAVFDIIALGVDNGEYSPELLLNLLHMLNDKEYLLECFGTIVGYCDDGTSFLDDEALLDATCRGLNNMKEEEEIDHGNF